MTTRDRVAVLNDCTHEEEREVRSIKDKDISNEQILAQNLQKAIENIASLEKKIESLEKKVGKYMLEAEEARRMAYDKNRVKVILHDLHNSIRLKSSQGLFQHTETFLLTEAPTITQSDLIVYELEAHGYQVNIKEKRNNRVTKLQIEWK